MNLASASKCGISVYITFIVSFYMILILDIEPFSKFPNMISLIGNLMCFPMFWLGIKAHDEEKQKAWKWFALAAFVYFIGEAVWAYQEDILRHEPESPSICDFFYFFSNCICFLGLLSYIKQVKQLNLMSFSFDILISSVAAGGIIYNFFIKPILRREFADFEILFFKLYGPVMDTAILVGILMILFGADNKRFFNPSTFLITLSFFLMFELDQISLMADIYNLPFDMIMEPLWSIFYFLLSIASNCSDEQDVVLRDKYKYLNVLLEYFRILLPYIFTFSILFLVGREYQLFDSIFTWAMGLVALLSLRQIFVLIGNKHLMETIQKNEVNLNRQNLELQRLNKKIMIDAEIDFLTQLSNRRCIDKKFEYLTPSEGKTELIGVMLIDVDYFKRINDTFGHQTGDEVLQDVAQEISSVIRDEDIAGRFGGDEFIIILPGANIFITEAIADNLIKNVRNNKMLKDRGVTLSIGGTSCQVTLQDYNVQDILKQADDALYKSKENGRNQYQMFSN